MEIVPTTKISKNKFGFEDLMTYKAELKLQIDDKQQQISVSSKKFFSIETATNYFLGTIKKSFTLIDGILMGIKFMSMIKRFFRKKS